MTAASCLLRALDLDLGVVGVIVGHPDLVAELRPATGGEAR
jgi:hypothetical protein